MPKKSTDPFMGALWTALIADDLGPGGNRTVWAETPVRIRNRFIHAVRQVLQSGAAFQASTVDVAPMQKGAAPKARRAKGKHHDPRELQLPLMTTLREKSK